MENRIILPPVRYTNSRDKGITSLSIASFVFALIALATVAYGVR